MYGQIHKIQCTDTDSESWTPFYFQLHFCNLVINSFFCIMLDYHYSCVFKERRERERGRHYKSDNNNCCLLKLPHLFNTDVRTNTFFILMHGTHILFPSAINICFSWGENPSYDIFFSICSAVYCSLEYFQLTWTED